MSLISETIGKLKNHWTQPTRPIIRGEQSAFRLACSFASEGVERNLLDHFPFALPDDVREFWLISRSATLFEDQDYGQWGLELLDPVEALAETKKRIAKYPEDFSEMDLVLGRFLGDSDLLMISRKPGQENSYSAVIALPIDPRKDWPTVAKSFGEFLERLEKAHGDKYWEVRGWDNIQ